MIRPDRLLHQVNVSRWTREEAHAHLVTTFELAANHRPDLFEPYLIRLADAEQDERSQIAIMREARDVRDPVSEPVCRQVTAVHSEAGCKRLGNPHENGRD
jgi:hypothetical protein